MAQATKTIDLETLKANATRENLYVLISGKGSSPFGSPWLAAIAEGHHVGCSSI